MSVVKIDGIEYALDVLSDDAKGQIASIQVVDRCLNETKEQIAILQTARAAYAAALKNILESSNLVSLEAPDANTPDGDLAN